jgi:hypothetical protein
VAYLNITKDLTRAGRRQLKLGQILIFDYEGSPVYLKIMRKTRAGVWAKRLDPAKFLLPVEADSLVTIVPKK